MCSERIVVVVTVRLIVCARAFFEHPVACQRSQEYARNIDSIQGENNTWFAGSYLIEPFVHEQAIQSGLNAAGKLLDSMAPPTLVWPWSVPAWSPSIEAGDEIRAKTGS